MKTSVHDGDLAQERTEADMVEVYPYKVDLTNCDDEPLHHIQSIQAFACVLGLDHGDFRITHVSSNSEALTGRKPDALLGASIDLLEVPELTDLLRQGLNQGHFDGINPIRISLEIDGKQQHRDVIAQRVQQTLTVQFEYGGEGSAATPDHPDAHMRQHKLREAVHQIQAVGSTGNIFETTAKSIRYISGYDRVMVYQFDDDHNGEVVAESLKEGITPYLGLRYPATDIPKQARELYLRNEVRMIADVRGKSARLLATPGAAHKVLDLSLVDGRGVSPIHLEYLTNMGVAATMSIAIIHNDKLWGLFALHHYEPRTLDYDARQFLRFLGQVFSGHLALQSAMKFRKRVLGASELRSRLGEQVLQAQTLADGLVVGDISLLDLVGDVGGGAVCLDDELRLVGNTPSEELVNKITDFVKGEMPSSTTADAPEDYLYCNDHLEQHFPDDQELLDVAAGVMLVWIDRERSNFVAWFRPQLSRTVVWGGNPHKAVIKTETGQRLSPRKSFARYLERIEGRSAPWTRVEEDAALALRSHIKEVVMRRYHEVRQVNQKLDLAYKEMEAFSYTVSHDLRAPLRGIAGFSDLLESEYGSALDEDAIDMIRTIKKSTVRMDTFIQEMLELSRVGASQLTPKPLNLEALVKERMNIIKELHPTREVELTFGEGEFKVYADARLMRIAVDNLLSNSVKYTLDSKVAKIEFGTTTSIEHPNQTVYFLKDNACGFDQKFAHRAFEMFTRLNRDPKIEGSGVGLALVKRVIDKHHGSIWVTSAPDAGSTFYFMLDVDPLRQK